MKTLLLIDANSLIHRCFHALPRLTAPDGRPIQAILGLANILLKITKEEKPEYAAASFDRPEPTFREVEYPKYKAQRPPTPDDLISQIIEAQALFEKFGIRVFEKIGFEADDLVATLAERFSAKGARLSPACRQGRDEQESASDGKNDLQIVILTGDLDTLQLIKDEKIVVRTFRKGISETTLYDEKAVEERYGLKPSQLIDYKALIGDVSDNIRGVKGIGPKTATELLKKFGNLEKIYENLAETPGKIREKLQENEGQAMLSKKLVTLERNLDLGVGEIDELRIKNNRDELREYFQKAGFKMILKRLDNIQATEPKEPAGQGKIFS